MAFGFARTIIAGMVIFIGVAILIMLSALGNTAQQTESLQATVVPFLACRFTNTTPQNIPVYSAPFSAELLQIDVAVDSVQLTVTEIRSTHVFVILRGNYGGWVERDFGVLTGNCDEFPMDETPLTEFSTVCFFRPTEPTTLYRDSSLQEAVQGLVPADSYVIIGQTDNTYQIRISSLIGGFADKTKGLTRGACGLVPMVTAP
jgi:ABC-type antimicrobial peptide transport system permease subunit